MKKILFPAALILLFVGILGADPIIRRFEGATLNIGDFLVYTGDLVVGNGTPDVTQNGEDAYIEGTLEVDGAARFDGALTLGGAITQSADLTVSSDSTGGNAGARNEIQGLFKLDLVALGTMTNGTTETTSYMDDSPTGEYAPIDPNHVTEAEGSTDTIYRVGSSSYKATFATTASADDGFKRTITGDDLEANESIGFWIYPTVDIDPNELQILLTDDGGARNFDISTSLTASQWTWVEVDISSLTGGTGDVVSEFGITLTSAGATALGAFSVYVDGVWKWDADDEEALGLNIVQDGVLSVINIATAAGSANTAAAEVDGTDFFVHYESGNDFLVTVSDQSGNSGLALVAHQ